MSNHSIFEGTIVDLTYPELEAAIARGAVGLWGLGVVEEHGPHLPLGTDIYMPYTKVRRIADLLADKGIETVILPPYYWGVNDTTASFPGSINVRPDVMVEIMADVLQSLQRHGLTSVFCVTGHLETLHCQTIVRGVEAARQRCGIQAYFVGAPALLERMDCDPQLPHVLPYREEEAAGLTHYIGKSGPAGTIEIHAGRWETSNMLAFYPDLVRQDLVASLPATDLTFPDLVRWREGGDVARSVTPRGYFGAPALASASDGDSLLQVEAAAVVEAIMAELRPRK